MAENKKTFDFGSQPCVEDKTNKAYKNTWQIWQDEASTWTPSTITTSTITANNTNYVFPIPSTYDSTIASSNFTITYSDPIPWNTSSVYTKQAGIISLVIFMCFLKDVIQFSKEQDIKLQELRIKTINDEILF